MHGLNRNRNRLLLAGLALVAAILFAAALFGDGSSDAGDRPRGDVVRLPVNSTVLPRVPAPEPLPQAAAPAPEPEEAEAPAAPEARAEKPLPAPKPVPAQAEAQGTGTVTDLSFTPKSDAFVLDVRTDRPVGRYTYFSLKDKGRFVIDLHGKWRKKGPLVFRPRSGPVSKVIVGEHPDKLRIVLVVKTSLAAAEPFFTDTGQGLEIVLGGL